MMTTNRLAAAARAPRDVAEQERRARRRADECAGRLLAMHGTLPFRAAIRRCGVWRGATRAVEILRGLWIDRTAARIGRHGVDKP